MKQRTLANTVETVGVGLHSGKRVLLKMKPALANTGIIFKRVDLEPNVEIKLDANLVQDTMLCTALVDNDGNTISTIEHLNAALFAMGIDNAIIEVDADEIPIMDGSASPFIYLIKSAGIRELSNKKKFLKIKKTIEVNPKNFETNKKGIFAVGDICSYPGKLKLILSGFHEVALASVECFKRARPNEKYKFEFTTSSKKIQDRLGKK